MVNRHYRSRSYSVQLRLILVLFIIFDFDWLSGGEIESGFLLIVELDDSSSWEESSSFSEANSDVLLPLELSFSL